MRSRIWMPPERELSICGAGAGAGFGGSPSPWTPAALGATLEGWWRADVGVTLTAGRVSGWDDQSGKGHHWAQTDALYQPVVNAGTILFTAANKERLTLSGGTLISGLAAAHIFARIQLTADPTVGNNDGLWYWGSTAARFVFSGDRTVYDNFGTSARKTSGIPAVNMASTRRTYEAVSAPGDWQAWVDGTSLAASQANTVAWSALQMLGADATFSYCLDGRIKEIVLANAKLTGADLTSLRAYMGAL